MEVLEVGNAQMACRHLNLKIEKIFRRFRSPIACCHILIISQNYYDLSL